jgi:hypothetical protein
LRAFLDRDLDQRGLKRLGYRDSAMAGRALDDDARLGTGGERTQDGAVQLVHHPEHRTRFYLGHLVVGGEIDTLERDTIASRVAILAADAKPERKLAHALRQFCGWDVLGVMLQVAKRLRHLGIQSCRRDQNHRDCQPPSHGPSLVLAPTGRANRL